MMEEQISFTVYADIDAYEITSDVTITIGKSGFAVHDMYGNELAPRGVHLYGKNGKRMFADDLQQIISDFLL